jgi:hypothetical protein
VVKEGWKIKKPKSFSPANLSFLIPLTDDNEWEKV